MKGEPLYTARWWRPEGPDDREPYTHEPRFEGPWVTVQGGERLGLHLLNVMAPSSPLVDKEGHKRMIDVHPVY